jgi:ATP-binding cassette subfamily C protein
LIELLRGLANASRKRAAAALILSVLVGLTEGLTVVILIPLLRLAGIPFAGSVGSIDRRVSAALGAIHVPPTLISVLAVYLVLTIALATLTRARLMADARAVHAYSFALRERLYRAIAKAEWLTVARLRSSDITYALTTAVDQIESSALNALYFVSGLIVALVYAALALKVSPGMSAIVIAASFVLVLIERARAAAGRTAGGAITTRTQELFATASEQLAGLKTAKSYGQEERHLAMFLDVAREVNATRVNLTKTFAAVRWQMNIGAALALALILYLAVGVFHLPTAALLVLLFVFSRLVPRVLGLQQTYQDITTGVSALDTVNHLTADCERSPQTIDSDERKLSLGRAVDVNDVTFGYDANGLQLSGVSMQIPAGRTVAIVGPSGAGKTTLADLLLGLIKPQSGTVMIDDTNLDSRLRSWRSSIGYVAQDTFLFNDTVRANLKWAAPDATEKEMLSALSAASADFVVKLPNGLDTVVGERGVRLSGGERQRISLARALLRKPQLLVLDEPTSALDAENEERIYRAISELHGGLTIVVITHRLGTIRNADSIYLLENGRVQAKGTWNELLGGSSRFLDLCRAQGITN